MDKTTGTVTVNKAGPYLIGCSAYFAEGFVPFDTMHLGAYINNNIDNLVHTLRKAPGTGTAAVNPYEVVNAFGIRQLAVGDKITLQAYNQTSSRGVVVNGARNKLFLIKLTNS